MMNASREKGSSPRRAFLFIVFYFRHLPRGDKSPAQRYA
jgi:hypothetical protein